MPKMIVGRQVEYIEIFEIDTNEIPSIRDDLDLCQRVLWAADPVFSQQLKSGKENCGIRFLSRTFDGISNNPIYPVSSVEEGIDEAVPYKLFKN